MKVKIINCSDRADSYKHLIGKILDVINSNHMLCVINDDKCIYNVSINDTIPVNEIKYEVDEYGSKTFCQNKNITYRVGSFMCNEL